MERVAAEATEKESKGERKKGRRKSRRGAKAEAAPTREDELARDTVFTVAEINGSLATRFAELPAHDAEDRVPAEQVLRMPELAGCPFGRLLLSLASSDGGDWLSFDDYVRLSSHVDGGATAAQKLRLAFDMCNVDKRGNLGSSELFAALRLTMGRQLCDDALHRLVSGYMKRYPQGLSGSEFTNLIVLSDLGKLTSRA